MQAMKRTTLIAAACALLIVTTGVAVAVPGNAPVDAGENSANDRADRSENRSAAGEPDERADAGPNAELPEQVPDHVSAIHDRISSFLDGTLEGSLGDAISEVTPGDDESDEADDTGEDGETDATDDTDERSDDDGNETSDE